MDWLANLTVKHVLLAVGGLQLFLAFARLGTRRRDLHRSGVLENAQVVLSVVVLVFLGVRPYLFQAFYIPSPSMEPTLLGPATPGEGVTGDRLLVNKLIYRVTDPQRRDIVVFKAPPAASPEQKEFIKRVIGLPGETVEVVPSRLLVDGRPLLRLSAEMGADRALNVPKDSLPVPIEENSATVKLMGGSALRVIVRPDARVEAHESGVDVNGARALSSEGAPVRELDDLEEYGAARGVRGRLFSLNGETRLLVASGARLEYDGGHVLVNGRRLTEPYVAEPPEYAMAPVKLGRREYFMMGDNRNNSDDSHRWGSLVRERMIGRAEIVFWPVNRLSMLHWWLAAVLLGLFALYQGLLRMRTGR